MIGIKDNMFGEDDDVKTIASDDEKVYKPYRTPAPKSSSECIRTLKLEIKRGIDYDKLLAKF